MQCQLLDILFIGGLHHAVDSLVLMFYRLGFSFIDGNVVLDHRSLVQVCRPLHWLFHCLVYCGPSLPLGWILSCELTWFDLFSTWA